MAFKKDFFMLFPPVTNSMYGKWLRKMTPQIIHLEKAGKKVEFDCVMRVEFDSWRGAQKCLFKSVHWEHFSKNCRSPKIFSYKQKKFYNMLYFNWVWFGEIFFGSYIRVFPRLSFHFAQTRRQTHTHTNEQQNALSLSANVRPSLYILFSLFHLQMDRKLRNKRIFDPLLRTHFYSIRSVKWTKVKITA